MDQGIAGVIAGIAGLFGAGVGGLATAYGARIGAQKTLEAASMQAERQSTFEHLHWIREQRRQVYSDVLASHASLWATTINWAVELRQGRPLPNEDHLRFKEQFFEMVDATARADLWGPTAVLGEGHAMRRAAGEEYAALSAWSHAIRAEETSDIQDFLQRYETAREAYGEARSAFIQAAVNALQF
ncbi:hypothetical protein ACFVY7_02550 [[Kitasatospora] papulosa]|uniref:hypothetical protein n=1 Tax=[Kitasatospora] papulosa TaxID=1464011 RepID=UPI003687EB49